MIETLYMRISTQNIACSQRQMNTCHTLLREREKIDYVSIRVQAIYRLVDKNADGENWAHAYEDYPPPLHHRDYLLNGDDTENAELRSLSLIHI